MVVCMTGDEYQTFALLIVSICLGGGLFIGWFTMYWHLIKKIQDLQERIQIHIGYRTSHEPGGIPALMALITEMNEIVERYKFKG